MYKKLRDLYEGTRVLDNGQNEPSKEWLAHVLSFQGGTVMVPGMVAVLDEGEDEPVKKNIPKELFLGWDALDRSNKLKQIKADDYTLYAVIYQQKFGKWPEDKGREIDFIVKQLYEQALREYHVSEMENMSWGELMKNGLTGEYRRVDSDGYAVKFKKKFGVDPKL